MTVDILLFKATLLAYFVATLLYLIGVISRRENLGQFAKWVLVTGFTAHCATLMARWLATGQTYSAVEPRCAWSRLLSPGRDRPPVNADRSGRNERSAGR